MADTDQELLAALRPGPIRRRARKESGSPEDRIGASIWIAVAAVFGIYALIVDILLFFITAALFDQPVSAQDYVDHRLAPISRLMSPAAEAFAPETKMPTR